MASSIPLQDLCARHALDDAQRARLQAVLDLLAADPQAPSSVTDPIRAVDVHLADSLTALDLPLVRSAAVAVDIGAGAGFPGLPLAVAMPACKVALLESQERKCGYLERCLSVAGIGNAFVARARAEQWREGLGRHDLAVARALAAQPVVLEYAAPLLALGGALVDWRGRRDHDEESSALRAAAELGLELVAIEAAQPYAAARDHHLHVYVKAGETPSRFPRRVGIARKRPLGISTVS
ncbi:MAG TPA: RsmG family class I SAM-dependent methyltransferase [Solirubrobacteraceae bacterium]|nr:RsmG family class I SAM-dependent methyltransferase [Solirubrobacteraceae bacterium]